MARCAVTSQLRSMASWAGSLSAGVSVSRAQPAYESSTRPHPQRRSARAMLDACRHHHLLLLPPAPTRVRCQACHLTIAVDELSYGYCPECFEVRGQERSAFEDVPEVNTSPGRYRCEDCGVVIDG